MVTRVSRGRGFTTPASVQTSLLLERVLQRKPTDDECSSYLAFVQEVRQLEEQIKQVMAQRGVKPICPTGAFYPIRVVAYKLILRDSPDLVNKLPDGCQPSFSVPTEELADQLIQLLSL